ncbi:MAG TPA: TetR/AcrR family transcriptional regulator [Ilumatobacter sp.]|nr:TetR/AcrR family transcriptional regulator [Ilumatobacter sp.]
MPGDSVETRILDAVERCVSQWGFTKVTIDDVVAESGVSRATLYRLFPGGRDVLFEALRVRRLNDFFSVLTSQVEGATDLLDVIVRSVVASTLELRNDDQLASMLASEPGETLGQLTVDGYPRIVRMATVTLTPYVSRFVDASAARRLIDVLARLTISYFLAPSADLDLGDAEQARDFLRPVVRVLACDSIDVAEPRPASVSHN